MRKGDGPVVLAVRHRGADPAPRRRPARRAGYPIADPRSGVGTYRAVKVSLRFRQQVRRIMPSCGVRTDPSGPAFDMEVDRHSGESSLARPALLIKMGLSDPRSPLLDAGLSPSSSVAEAASRLTPGPPPLKRERPADRRASCRCGP